MPDAYIAWAGIKPLNLPNHRCKPAVSSMLGTEQLNGNDQLHVKMTEEQSSCDVCIAAAAKYNDCPNHRE